MFLIGSTGSNTGKTTLACKLLNKFASSHKITAVKITAIKEKGGKCPRGGQGCGVCTSLEGKFDITEEKDPCTGKDTSKLLVAGAAKVYWMRVLYEHLDEGFDAMLEVLPENNLIICESNAIRDIVRPAVFIMTDKGEGKFSKPSATRLMPLVDELLIFSDNKSDDLLERISIQDNKWKLRYKKAIAI